MKKLEELRVFLRGIPNINFGGCGIAALAMFRIAKREGLNPQIIYIYDPSDIEEMEWFQKNSALLSGSGDGDTCLHALITVGNKNMDCFDEIDINPFLVHIMPEAAVIKTLNTPTWNFLFKRDTYLPIIEQFIGEKLLL